MADTKWTDKDTKELRDFGIQILTLRSLNGQQSIRLCELIAGVCERVKELKTEIQEVSNQLLDLYDKCNETTKPEFYGTVLGLHERLEQI